ncbi:hypothetical protein EDD11_010278 [Mortierella claussenii]|nr:hypothetical protein EDD11_010278 [Mortierella claussenii]
MASNPHSVLAPAKVAIIGAGDVGASTAFACVMRAVAQEILLYDINTSLAHGHVLDLEDASSFLGSSSIASCSHSSHTSCYSSATATAQDCGQADIIVITAGYRNAPGESREQVLHRNQAVLQDILVKISPIKSSAILLMVTNPVNIMTALAQKLSGLPLNQVFGTGTILDTIRLRSAIKKRFQQEQQDHEGCPEHDAGLSESSIQANVIGDHGDKQVALWSAATIGGYPLTSFKAFEMLNVQADVARQGTSRVYEINEHKLGSSFGIAVIVAEIISTIFSNRRTVLPLSVYSDRYDACLSLPVILGAHGVGKIIYPQMDTKEQAALTEYIRTNRETCAPYLHPRDPSVNVQQFEAKL